MTARDPIVAYMKLLVHFGGTIAHRNRVSAAVRFEASESERPLPPYGLRLEDGSLRGTITQWTTAPDVVMAASMMYWNRDATKRPSSDGLTTATRSDKAQQVSELLRCAGYLKARAHATKRCQWILKGVVLRAMVNGNLDTESFNLLKDKRERGVGLLVALRDNARFQALGEAFAGEVEEYVSR